MSRAEDLFNRTYYTEELTNQEILDLKKEIKDFFQSNEPEEDKEELGSYMESFFMLCSAIEEGYLENRKPSPPVFPKKRHTFKLEIPEFMKRGIQSNVNNDEEVKKYKKLWEEIFTEPFPLFIFDEFGGVDGIEDYKRKIKKAVDTKDYTNLFNI
ncbi:hypothetical protein AAK894_13135 [Lachnospiraceae bacterium 46-61]